MLKIYVFVSSHDWGMYSDAPCIDTSLVSKKEADFYTGELRDDPPTPCISAIVVNAST